MLNYVHKWPLCVHFIAAFFCLFCSSVYHLFFVKDEFWREKLAQLDYGGIIILILGSTYPLVWYSFACKEVLFVRNVFVGSTTTLSFISFIMFFTKTFNRPDFKGVRVTVFVTLASCCASPFFYLGTTSQTLYLSEFDMQPWVIGALCYFVGAVLYAT